jgi:hypothetical protein
VGVCNVHKRRNLKEKFLSSNHPTNQPTSQIQTLPTPAIPTPGPPLPFHPLFSPKKEWEKYFAIIKEAKKRRNQRGLGGRRTRCGEGESVGVVRTGMSEEKDQNMH